MLMAAAATPETMMRRRRSLRSSPSSKSSPRRRGGVIGTTPDTTDTKTSNTPPKSKIRCSPRLLRKLVSLPGPSDNGDGALDISSSHPHPHPPPLTTTKTPNEGIKEQHEEEESRGPPEGEGGHAHNQGQGIRIDGYVDAEETMRPERGSELERERERAAAPSPTPLHPTPAEPDDDAKVAVMTKEISPEVGCDDGDDEEEEEDPHVEETEAAVVVARSVTIDVDSSGGDEDVDVDGDGKLNMTSSPDVQEAEAEVAVSTQPVSDLVGTVGRDVPPLPQPQHQPQSSSSSSAPGGGEEAKDPSSEAAAGPGTVWEEDAPGSGGKGGAAGVPRSAAVATATISTAGGSGATATPHHGSAGGVAASEDVPHAATAAAAATIPVTGASAGATPHQRHGTDAEGVPLAAAAAATVSATGTSATPHQGGLNDEDLLKPPLTSLSEFSPLSFEEGMEMPPVPVPSNNSSSSCDSSAPKCPTSSSCRRGKREKRGLEVRGDSDRGQQRAGGGGLSDIVTPVQLKIASSPVEAENEESVEAAGRKRRRLDGVDDNPHDGSDRRPKTMTTGTTTPAPAPFTDVPQAMSRSRDGGGKDDASDTSSASRRNRDGVPEQLHTGRGRGRGAAAIVGRGGRSRRDSRERASHQPPRFRSSSSSKDRSPLDIFTSTEAVGLGRSSDSPSCHHDRPPVPADDGGGAGDPVPAEDVGDAMATVGITRPTPRRGAPRSCAMPAGGDSATMTMVPKEDVMAKKTKSSSKRKRSISPSAAAREDHHRGAEAPSRSSGRGGRDDERETSAPFTTTSTSTSGGRVQFDTTWAKSTARSQGAELNAIQTILIELLRRVRRKCDRYGFFSRPVDPTLDGCPDYYDAVDRETEAMDLGTMETMIRDGRIGDTHDFDIYLGRIVRCALRYNTDPDNFVRRQALELEQLAPPMVEKSRRAVERMCQLRSGTGVAATAEQAVAMVAPPPSAAAAVAVAEALSFPSSSAAEVSDGADVSAAVATSDEAEHAVETHNDTKGSEEVATKTIPTTMDSMPSHASRDDEGARGTATQDTTFDTSMPGGEIPRCRRDLSSSVVTKCTSREEWLSLCPEMLVVTNEAARRATLSVDPDADRYDKPLSETYMRERLDCHLPLHGYSVRVMDPSSKPGDGSDGAVRRRGRPPKKKKRTSSLGLSPRPQHLQGFIVTSTFITWRRTFRWDVDDPRAGITPSDRRARPCDDGTLTSDLQRQERRHDAANDCFVFPRIAEITLLGGLGCGGALVRMAMDDLERSGQYDLVVLQATKMAIPFYERMGFVRVGAVARFYDSEELPEVAYRHWSETTGKQAIEASYMMAARLSPPGSDRSTVRSTSPDGSSTRKVTTAKDEIDLSRRHTLEMIRDCLPIHTGKAGGSFSYRELAGIAKRLASSVGDNDLADHIGRALDVYRSNAPGNSKNMLREALDLPIFHPHTAETNASEPKKTSAQRPSTGSRPVRGGKVIRISRILVDGVPISSGGDDRGGDDGDCLHAVLPANARRPRRNSNASGARATERNCVKVSVVVLGRTPHSLGLCEADATLTAIIDHGDADADGPESDHDNDKAMKEALRASLKNLRRGIKAMVHGVEPGADPIVAIGDKVMVQVEADENEEPSWQMARVLRKCKKYEIPDGGNVDNSYVVRSSGGPKFGFAFVLDGCGGGMDRGIGRKWCTMCDWTGFPNLDHSVLDSLLIGSSVHYVSAEGDRVVGVVSQRVRDSRVGCSKWRVERHNVPGGVVPEGSSCFVDLDPAELRECVRISDETMRRVADMVLSKDSFPQQKGKAAGAGSRKRKRSTISEEEEERKYRGVYRAGKSRWCAKLCHEGRLLHLGTFDSQLAASEAFQEAFKRIKGCSPE